LSTAGRGHVVVTGTSTGIGRAVALRLAREGFSVFAGVRREEDGASLRGEASGSIEPVMLDVTSAESIAAAASRVNEGGGGRLAGLVNNAGVAVAGPLEALPIDDFRHQIEVNLVGQVAVTQAMLPMLRPAKGRIVMISSIGGRLATPFMGAYHAAKFGLEAVSDSLRQELSPFGVEVVVVEPGTISTPIWTKGAADAKATRERLGPESEALYGGSLDKVEAIARKSRERGIPPDKVAETVLRALTAGRPRTRYQVGLDSKVGTRIRALAGDRLMDRLIARATGL
jgi:NAD(P)-dependent dehydrogenase (short-subunit alcohol dehydrogenase family)